MVDSRNKRTQSPPLPPSNQNQQNKYLRQTMAMFFCMRWISCCGTASKISGILSILRSRILKENEETSRMLPYTGITPSEMYTGIHLQIALYRKVKVWSAAKWLAMIDVTVSTRIDLDIPVVHCLLKSSCETFTHNNKAEYRLCHQFRVGHIKVWWINFIHPDSILCPPPALRAAYISRMSIKRGGRRRKDTESVAVRV
jgi:hypothetical protein